MDKISIIVPVYNVEKYIGSCIESLVAQTYKNTEIILINDGSTDESLKICLDREKKDERIIVIDQENAGVSAARNSGIEKCTGKWICFVDGDDYLEPDAVEKMTAALGADTDVLITDYFVDTDTKSRGESFFSIPDHDFSPDEHIELIKNCFLKTSFSNKGAVTMVGVPWAKLYRAKTIKENGIWFDLRLRKMQDAVFNSEVFINSKSISFRKIRTCHYRQNSSSVTHRGNKDYRAVADAVLCSFKEFIEKYGLEDELMPVYYARKFMFAFESVKFIYILDESGLSFRQKAEGTGKIMRSLDLAEHEKELFPYLGRAHRIAFALYKAGTYRLMYLMMAVYFKYKMRRMK